MEQKHFVLTLSNRDLACTVELNGIPVFTDNVRNEMDMTLHLNPHVIQGRNELELILTVPPGVMELPEGPVTISGGIDRILGTEEEYASERVLEFEWTLPADAEFPIHLPYDFEAEEAYGPREWETAERVSEARLDHAEPLRLVRLFRDILLSKDFGALEPLLAAKHRELSRAFAFPVDELLRDDRTLFEQMFADPAWGLVDYDETDLVFEHWADDRILSILRPDGKELLRTNHLAGLGITFSLPMQLAKIRGKWTLIG